MNGFENGLAQSNAILIALPYRVHRQRTFFSESPSSADNRLSRASIGDSLALIGPTLRNIVAAALGKHPRVTVVDQSMQDPLSNASHNVIFRREPARMYWGSEQRELH